jgi:hypothetical protein
MEELRNFISEFNIKECEEKSPYRLFLKANILRDGKIEFILKVKRHFIGHNVYKTLFSITKTSIDGAKVNADIAALFILDNMKSISFKDYLNTII